MAVASIILVDGEEDHAIAALLHDSIEDQGFSPEEIEHRFGKAVRDLVVGCTDAFEQPKLPWRGRKEKCIEHLYLASPDVLRYRRPTSFTTHAGSSLIIDSSATQSENASRADETVRSGTTVHSSDRVPRATA
jgi:hypothetical protein